VQRLPEGMEQTVHYAGKKITVKWGQTP